jgi:hypothetical protein
MTPQPPLLDREIRDVRSGFLRRAAVAAGALATAGLGAGTAAKLAASAPSPAQDAKILNFLLVVEYAQSALYDEALKAGALRGELREFARLVAAHEREHVALLRRELGSRARGRPSLDLGGAASNRDDFLTTALALESAALGAYIGQAANVTKPVVSSLARICAVDARHTAWLRDIAGEDPAPYAADRSRTSSDVLKTLRKAGLRD